MTALDDLLAACDEALESVAEASEAPWRLSMTGYSVKSADDRIVMRCPEPQTLGPEGWRRWAADSDVALVGRDIAPRIARALKAVAQVLEDESPLTGRGASPEFLAAYDDVRMLIRAAIERRIQEKP